uniref:Ig-like domain-containing protein n=1 Tax=Trichobilharzia regenti TaxID=157069 RepID=A0AA85ITF3_TRIRE|nr:unnamed protein product [Trichobilharzia regenti]
MTTTLSEIFRYLFLVLHCCSNMVYPFHEDQNVTSQHLELKTSTNKNDSIIVEALWDEATRNQTQTTIQAGDSITFVCRIWTFDPSLKYALKTGVHKPEQSVFLFCPMSVAYCAQDCLLVDANWPFQCTRQFRIVSNSDLIWSKSREFLDDAEEWRLQEVIYKVDIATIISTGSWSCSYGGYHSNSLELLVRDRPALLSLTSSPPSPVSTGDNVKLTCEAAPSPNAPWYSFVWRRLGSPLPLAHSTLRLSDTISVLTLISIQPTDDGIYTCRILQSSSNAVNDEWWEKSEIVESKIGNSTGKMMKLTKDPAIRRLHLSVFHPPTHLNLTVHPIGPYKPQTKVNFTCHVHGGKPKPMIHFYRTTLHLNNGNISYLQSNSQNVKHMLENITQSVQSTELIWQLTEADNTASFGCAATSPVIKDQIYSGFIKTEIIFPPGQPILSASPHGPVSENRTKVFTCQSSKGSNPTAKILWELIPAVEYITATAVSKRNYANQTGTNEKQTTIQPKRNSDFQMEMSDTYSNTKEDPNNKGYMAYSEIRLIARPWFNGARVFCHLIWNEEGNYTDKRQHDYHKTVYLSIEVFFCPSAVSLITIPQNGIQETYGEQILECTATSSHPPAIINWFQHNSSGSVHKTTTENVIMESSLMKVEALPKSNLLITTETFPGIHGGKRVVSRLKLNNISRNNDGMLYTCVVKHIEWTESISRTHQLMVLYPPELKMLISPKTWQKRFQSNQTTVLCEAEGGRPRYIEEDYTVEYNQIKSRNNESVSALNRLLRHDESSMWKFSWKFRPHYPDNWMEYENQESVSDNLKVPQTSNKLVFSHPGRKQAGEYTCLLEGPAGVSQVTRSLNFGFPPELAPPGITSVTAALDSQTVIELHIWTYPIPSFIIDNSKRTKAKHPSSKNCGFYETDTQPPNKVNTLKKTTFTWYKVKTKRISSEVDILQKELIHDNWSPSKLSEAVNTGQRIWTDAVLIQLPYYDSDEQINKNASQNNKEETLRKIPTIIYRLFLSPITEKDYGEYMCEIEHETGKRQFFMQVQPPGDPPITVKIIRFVREQSHIRVYFDPLNLLKSKKTSGDHDLGKNKIEMKTELETNRNGKISLPPSSVNDNRQQLKWKASLRICASFYSERNKLSGNSNNECAFSSHLLKKIPRRPNYVPRLESYRLPSNNLYGISSLPNECIEALIEYPEKGRIEIPIIYSNSFTEKNLSNVRQRNETNQTLEVKNLLEDKTMHNDIEAIKVYWSDKEKLTYQFRFYDETGGLTYATDWFYEDDNFVMQSAISMLIYHKPYMWIIIAGVLIFILSAILLILILRKRFSMKKDFQTTFNQSLTPLNKSIMNSPAASPIANCKLQENFYVANMSVVDSPCPLMNRNDQINGKQFLPQISPAYHDKDFKKLSNESYQSMNKYTNPQPFLHQNIIHKTDMLNDENESLNMPKNLFELRYNELDLSHNQCSSEGLADEISYISPVTYSPVASHFSPLPLIRSTDHMVPSSSLLFYNNNNNCCYNRKFGFEMNHSLPPLFGPVPFRYHSQSLNSSSELSSPLLGSGSQLRKLYPTPPSFCYHQNAQNINPTTTTTTPTTGNINSSSNSNSRNKLRCQGGKFDGISNVVRKNQSKLNNISNDDPHNTMTPNNPAKGTPLASNKHDYSGTLTDSGEQFNSLKKPTNRSHLIKNNLYSPKQQGFDSEEINQHNSNTNNINTSSQDSAGIFYTDKVSNNNPNSMNNNNNVADHYSTQCGLNRLDLNHTVYNTHPSDSEHLSSPVAESRQTPSAFKTNNSSVMNGNSLANNVNVNDFHFNKNRYLEKQPCKMTMSTFTQNLNLLDRLSPYDNTTTISNVAYSSSPTNRMTVHTEDLPVDNKTSIDGHCFPDMGDINTKKCCKINAKSTDVS